jgi:hypothetical protein
MIEQPTNGNGASGITGADMLALIAHMSNLLSVMEGRIMAQLAENSAGATGRWATHEKRHADEYADHSKRVTDRFMNLETALDDHIQATNRIFAKLHDDGVTRDARIRPVKSLARTLVTHWRSIALAILAVAGLLGWAGLETHILGR